VNALLFLHVLVAMAVVGALIAAAVAAQVELWDLARRAAVAALATTIAAIGLGEGLAADQGVRAAWVDASRALGAFGLLLGGALLVVLTGPSRLRRLAAPTAVLLVLVGLATAFVMAAKPS
jgi:hypothetical protein